MPMNLNQERLNDEDGIESTLRRHKAGWHKSCRLKFNKRAYDVLSQKLNRPTEQQEHASSVHTRSAHRHSQSTEPACFFCDKPAAASSSLHDASTYNIDANVQKCALALEDMALLANLSKGDMIAIEAKYHHFGLVSLYNKARQATSKSNDEDGDSCLHGIAFAQLVAYLEDTKSDESTAPVFKLTDIAKLYKIRLEQLGLTVDNRIHTTRLKNRLLSEKDIGPALMTACHDAMHLM